MVKSCPFGIPMTSSLPRGFDQHAVDHHHGELRSGSFWLHSVASKFLTCLIMIVNRALIWYCCHFSGIITFTHSHSSCPRIATLSYDHGDKPTMLTSMLQLEGEMLSNSCGFALSCPVGRRCKNEHL